MMNVGKTERSSNEWVGSRTSIVVAVVAIAMVDMVVGFVKGHTRDLCLQQPQPMFPLFQIDISKGHTTNAQYRNDEGRHDGPCQKETLPNGRLFGRSTITK